MKKMFFVFFLFVWSMSIFAVENPIPVDEDLGDVAQGSYIDSKSVIESTHKYLYETISCIVKMIPNKNFDPKVMDLDFDQRVDASLTFLDRLSSIKYYISPLEAKNLVKDPLFLKSYQQLRDDCVSRLGQFHDDYDNNELSKKDRSYISKKIIPLYMLADLSTKHKTSSFQKLSILIKGDALCEDKLTITGFASLAVLLGIGVEFPSFHKLHCFDREIKNIYNYRYLGGLYAVATPGIMAFVGGEGSNVRHIKNKKFWTSSNIGGGIGLAVIAMYGSKKGLQADYWHPVGDIGGGGGIYSSPVAWNIHAMIGKGLHHSKIKIFDKTSKKDIHHLISAFKNDNVSMRLKNASTDDTIEFFNWHLMKK